MFRPNGSRRVRASQIQFEWVEDLVYFEGPLLSYIRGGSQQDYFYSWVDSDEYQNRWLAIPVTRDEIRDYKSRELSLLDLMNSDKRFFYVDVSGDLEVVRAYSVNFKALPESIKPLADSYFDPALCPTGDKVLADAVIYKLALDREWFFEDWQFVPRRYIQLYSFVYTLLNLDKLSVRQNVESIFEKYPWRGGASRVHFYNDLNRAIPSMHEPAVKEIQYASPGHISLELWSAGATKLREIGNVCANHISISNECIRSIRKIFNDNGLNRLNGVITTLGDEDLASVESLSNRLCSALGLMEFSEDLQALTFNDPIKFAKVLISFHNRIEPLISYVERKMLAL